MIELWYVLEINNTSTPTGSKVLLEKALQCRGRLWSHHAVRMIKMMYVTITSVPQKGLDNEMVLQKTNGL